MRAKQFAALRLPTLLLLLIGAFSCSDFLEEEPRSEVAVNQFFTEPAHAENAVNALYRDGAPAMWMFGGVYSGRQVFYGPYLSGFIDNGYKGQEPFIQFAQQLTLDGINSNGFVNGMWSQMYRTISRANNAIKYIPTTEGVSDEQSNRLLGEARFFRAWAYFTLVRHFGDVPLVLEPYESLENIYVARSSKGDIYAQIVDDLNFAVDQAGLSQENMIDNSYRVTQGAAATLLADVQLTRSGFPVQEDNYAAAAAAARKVISAGKHALIQHGRDGNAVVELANSAYNKIRRQTDIKFEFVYPIEYTRGISGSPYPAYTYPVTLTNRTKYGITNGAFEPRPQILSVYDSAVDLRAVNKQFFHSTYYDAVKDTTVNFAPLPYLWHDDEALFGTTNPANSELEVKAYGYAETLLLAAEAIARSEGVTAEAVGYLTQVRSRAYYTMQESTIRDALTGLSAERFVEEVWKERYRELMLDSKMWFDMIRTRKYPEAKGGNVNFAELVGHVNTWGKTFESRHLLLPLPDQELQRNPELEQNTGYDN